MDFNFKKFERVKEPPTALVVYDTLVAEKTNRLARYKGVDIYLDKKKNAIKITEGDTYKVTKFSAGRHGFSAGALRKEGLKKGKYFHDRDGIYVFKNDKFRNRGKKAKQVKKTNDVLSEVPKSIVDPEKGKIDYKRLKEFLRK